MRKTILSTMMSFGVLLLASASSGSEPGDDSDEDASPEMATSEEATEPLGPNPPKDPFEPFAADPNAWTYDDLSTAERAHIDAQTAQARLDQDAYAAAAAAHHARAIANHAQFRLGLDEGLGSTGVVP